MAVTEVVRALGEWDIQLTPGTPKAILDLLDANRFGHIVIDAARDNPEISRDALLGSARYVGVLRGTNYDADGVGLSGCGMAFWLGDEDNKGDVIESPGETFSASTFTNAVRNLLPASGAVTEGTLHSIAGSYTGKHIYQSPRQAIDYVCDMFDADWRVNGNGTLDAGDPDDLFVTNPVAAVIRKADGFDMGLRALPGAAKLDRDTVDFTTRVVTIAEGNGRTVAVGTANISGGLNPYKDLHGNTVKLTRLVSESNTSLINADARAQLQLNRFTSPREALALSSTTHDIRGDVAVGDSVWVYDPDANLVDTANEVVFRGDRIWPVKQRVFQLSWPVTAGMGVYFRTGTGVWTDLTDYVVFDDSGQTTITVGGYNRSLTNSGIEVPGSRVVPDTSIPAAPTLSTPFTTSVYQSAEGKARARIIVAWTQPLNADGTSIIDGSHYEIQYRVSGQTEWQSAVTGFDFTTFSLLELSPATIYNIRVRAVDVATPPNFGAWSSTATTTTPGDTIAPATPAAATVAGNPVSVQVKHTLGVAAGGTYNLDADLHHLEVHASASGSGFTPDDTTKLGNLTATAGMIASTVPAIGTFTVASTAALWVKVIAVDESGNRSSPSAGATVTASLIDSAHISDVTATQITAGDLTATVGLLGLMRTATSGARFEAGVNGALNGWRLYRSSGTLAVQGQASTGSLIGYATDGSTVTFQLDAAAGTAFMSGTLESRQSSTDRIVIQPSGAGASGASLSEISFFASTLSPGYINGFPTTGSRSGLGMNSGNSVDSGTTRRQSTLRLFPQAFDLFVNTAPGDTAGVNYPRGARLSGSDTQLYGVVTDESGVVQTSAVLNGSQIQLSVRNDDDTEREGGYLWLADEFADTYVGHYVAGISVDTFLKFTADGDITLRRGTNQFLTMQDDLVDLKLESGVHLALTPSTTVLGSSGNSFIRINASGSIEFYEGGTGHSSLSSLKSFVIDHPSDPDRWLVHGCTESPTAGVEYAGQATIVDQVAVVDLPSYFEALCEAEGRHVLVSPVLDTVGGSPMVPIAAASDIAGGRFHILCHGPDGTRINWLVKATRKGVPFEVEPLRSEVTVTGDGPYRYITA